jgi:hypothetical protein
MCVSLCQVVEITPDPTAFHPQTSIVLMKKLAAEVSVGSALGNS